MMPRFAFFVILCSLGVVDAPAQNQPVDGLRSNPVSVYALTNARIVIGPGFTIERGTIVVRDERIQDVGPRALVPADARVYDLSGLTVYAGFIDLSTTLGMPKQPASGNEPPRTPEGPVDWNAKTLPHVNASDLFTVDEKAAEAFRSQGFVLALTHAEDGIFSGSAALVSTGSEGPRGSVIQGLAAQTVTFERAGSFLSGYPNSLMGIIAHVRQTFYDAVWYGQAQDRYKKDPLRTQMPEMNSSLAALQDAVNGRLPVVFSANDELNVLRAANVGKEFSLRTWIDGSGKEFRRLDAIRSANIPIILPVAAPEKPVVTTPEEALAISLEDLLEWDIAPENPARAHKAGITFAFTSRGLKDQKTFLSRVRSVIDRGLPEDEALAALTTTPARLLGMDKQYGTVEKGKRASFIVTDGDIFGDTTSVQEIWVEGKRYEVRPSPPDIRGGWRISMVSAASSYSGTLMLKGEEEKLSGSLNLSTRELSLSSVSFDGKRLSFNAPTDTVAGSKHRYQFSGQLSDSVMWGVAVTTEDSLASTSFTWNASRSASASPSERKGDNKKSVKALYDVVWPLGAFGRASLPQQHESVLFTGGTVWTMGPQGIVEGADVLVKRGKIVQVGKGIPAPAGAVVVDAKGRHITPGLFDAHSHTAVSGGVNEGGQAITAEVRIADVLDPDNIWIYRQLAGGTVGANILHGSANPIGGQNAVVKWRWGANPDEMLIKGAPAGVKFALGENVKRSHVTLSGGRPARYPRTRMGVEELIRDRFQAATEYERAWKEWKDNGSGLPPRRDLELDAILEMVKGTRLIHAHSYRQDEILMLLRVAEQYGIRIATLQHILEGYKVADVIAKHGAGASGFSDWWSYKWEAYDAIPGNLPLMHEQGVLVSYNSDDAQLATRLNWEAAKAVEFGLTPEEALAMVTINPAKQLRIDATMGSLESNKDADIVLWSGNPLSTQSICLQTWVDGRRYFDLEEDRKMQEDIAKMRAALVERALEDSKSDASSASGPPRGPRRPGELSIESCKEEENHD